MVSGGAVCTRLVFLYRETIYKTGYLDYSAGVLASALLLHRRLRTTASYLPREERYPVKSITNDDRTTCCGMRLVPSRSWPYFGIRYSKLACLKSARHVAWGYRRRCRDRTATRSFVSPFSLLRRQAGIRYVNGAGSS